MALANVRHAIEAIEKHEDAWAAFMIVAAFWFLIYAVDFVLGRPGGRS